MSVQMSSHCLTAAEIHPLGLGWAMRSVADTAMNQSCVSLCPGMGNLHREVEKGNDGKMLLSESESGQLGEGGWWRK